MGSPLKKLLAIAALAVAAAPSAAAAAKAPAVHQDPAVPQLLVPGDRVELGYSADSSGVKSLAGTLFVRTDLQRRFSPVAYQPRHALWGYQPLAGGRRLVSAVYTPPRSQQGPRDVRYALIGRGGRVVRAWRVLSRTQIFPGGGPFFTPGLVGGDPVIDLDVARPGQLEHVVLRLGPHGAKERFSLPYGIFGEGTSYADLPIGPDGKLYRLSTSPTNGVTISRYSLQP